MKKMRRKLIIKSAQNIFSIKGLENTSVAEIAKSAGVADSVLYHYFKNKEDLLFFALAEKMSEVLRELKLHLEGIEDPVSRLRKMIWFHLYLNDLKTSNTRLIKNLLFECRSNKNFYFHDGYRALQSYTRIMLDILRQGVDGKVFRDDLDIPLARDLIFGLLDEEALSCFSLHEIENTLPDFEDIVGLVLAMIEMENSEIVLSANGKSRKERIVLAAEEVFAEKGYQVATVSEVAIRAEVAEGTIYTYFENKKALLFSIPKKRLAEYRQSMMQIFEIREPSRKLRRIIRLHFTAFLANRDFLKVFLLHNKLNREFYRSSVYADFLDYLSSLESAIEEGKKTGVFRKNIDSRLFRNLFVGGFSHLATKWLILENIKAIDMVEQTESFVSFLCCSVLARDKCG